MREYLRAMAMGLSQWPKMILAFIGMTIDAVPILFVPLLVGRAFDIMSQPGPDTWSQLLHLALISAAVGAGRAAGIYLEIYMQEALGNCIGTDIRSALFQKLLRLPFSFFDQRKTGDIMSRMTKDIDAVRDGTGFVVLITVTNVIIFTGVVIAMATVNVTLTWIVLGLAPVILAVAAVYTRAISPLYREVEARSGDLHTVAQENVSGIRVVKAFTRAQEEAEKFDRENKALLDANLQLAHMNSLVNPAMELLGALMTLATLGLGGTYVAQGSMTIGGLVAFMGYSNLLFWPLRQAGWLADMISKAIAGATRIFQLLDESDQAAGERGGAGIGPIKGHLSFENVSFRYEDDDAYSLHDFNLKVTPGQKVAIVGGTGSGKTTVANLIPRFYDPAQGRILLDGRDLREWPLAQVRESVGFVFQDNFLFSLSLRENIALGRPSAGESELEAAASAAQISDVISGLPQKYETVVGERGVGLSGGEGKRVALARALLVNPPILVLDDSTSSLDARTENAVQQALDRLAADKAVVIVAQRVATAMHADWIVVLDQGRIVEEGTHQQLVAANGFYSRLYREQMTLLTEVEEDSYGEATAG